MLHVLRLFLILAMIIQLARSNFVGIGKRLSHHRHPSKNNRSHVAAFALPSTSFQNTLHPQYDHTYQKQKVVPISFLVATNNIKSTRLQLAASNNKLDTKSGAAYHASVNQQIVQRRNELSKRKKDARQKALDSDRERNLKLRSLFLEENQQKNAQTQEYSGGTNTGHVPPPPMFAIKVVTCPTLRSELKMNGREKRGRMFVERPPFFASEKSADDVGNRSMKEDDEAVYACMSLKALKQTIHEFFRRLKKSTYILSASLPTLDEEGNVLTHADDMIFENGTAAIQQQSMVGTWSLGIDDDVQKAFIQAEDFFLQHIEQNQTSAMKRPTLILHVTKDPDAPEPPPPPTYLMNMPDPQSSTTMTMLSFYAFPPNDGIPDPESTAEQLKRLWRPFRALGRIYVAKEGINAQMAVPTNVLPNFLQCCTLSIEEGGELSHVLGQYMENGINIDPVPVDIEEFRNNPPFKNMHVRVRSQIVADGFEEPLDWQNAGYDMPPLEWHEKLKKAREASSSSEDDNSTPELPIVLDCRNNYETQVGKFELAEPLNTENFRESWDVLKDRLKGVPKDAPIMTYCTGGKCMIVSLLFVAS